MTVRTAVLSTSGLLAGFALAATAMAGAAATPTSAPAAEPTAAAMTHITAGTLSHAAFQDSLNRAYFESKAAASSAPTADSTAAAATPTSGGGSAEVAAWASSPKSMSVKFCESTNNYSINTGNGYYGAWQFDYPSWHANGGGAYAEYPHQAPAWAQDQVAYNYWLKAGWGPWECG